MVDTDGSFRPCCYTIEMLRDESKNILRGLDLKSAFESEDFKQMRQDMLADKVPRFCIGCHEQEMQNISPSPRQEALKDFSPEQVANLSLRPMLEYLDFRETNLCNLGCLSCNGGSSSFIEREDAAIQERYPLFKTDLVQRHPINLRSSDLDTIKEIYLTGGEPTLNKNNIRMISDERIQKQARILSLNTNIAVFNLEFYKHLENFQQVKIYLSLDAVGNALEYLRYPIKWAKVQENFHQLFSLKGNIEITVTCVLQAANLFALKDFLLALSELRLQQKFKLKFISYLMNDIPAASDLGVEALAGVIAQIEGLNIHKGFKEKAVRILQKQLEVAEGQKPDLVKIHRYLLKTHYKDGIRKQQLERALPEFYRVATALLNK